MLIGITYLSDIKVAEMFLVASTEVAFLYSVS